MKKLVLTLLGLALPFQGALAGQEACEQEAQTQAEKIGVTHLKEFHKNSTSAKVREVLVFEEGKSQHAKKGEVYYVFDIANQNNRGTCVFVKLKREGCKAIGSGTAACDL